MESSGCWFNKLPKHMWELSIFSRLTVRDLVWSARVCRLWRSLACETLGRFHRLPWLMISRDKDTHIGTFLCLSDAKIYQLKLTPSASQSYCCGGSSKGYLIMANMQGNFLFDPFSKISIDLPKQYVPRQDMVDAAAVCDFRYYFTKAILSSSMPDSSQLVLAALCSAPHIVEMCRPHNAEWSVTNAVKEEDKGFIIPGRREPLAHIELNMLPMNRSRDAIGQNTGYLVESRGELLMVLRCYYSSVSDDGRTNKNVTTKFVVYKLDQSSVPFQWVQIRSLGDQMLYLGKNASISISAKGNPRIKGNCIYFSDDLWYTFWYGVDPRHLYSDNGVFYLEDGRIDQFFFPTDYDIRSFRSHPIWITPSNILGVQFNTAFD
ncbi:hypothetical protein FRX31_019226 [Thalictrum thalictroides]|uniref:F-box protein skip23 n=1 Tax=Thalictrum thalictroides TaxID=46969 RepID=A0A7J6W3T4_THATH|nr:hypothetical protein FRX31_019226 [Thalictrum thalictroides]